MASAIHRRSYMWLDHRRHAPARSIRCCASAPRSSSSGHSSRLRQQAPQRLSARATTNALARRSRMRQYWRRWRWLRSCASTRRTLIRASSRKRWSVRAVCIAATLARAAAVRASLAADGQPAASESAE
eukprot:scaffold36122_cov31-Tisochrysis_lutea.AAC.1